MKSQGRHRQRPGCHKDSPSSESPKGDSPAVSGKGLREAGTTHWEELAWPVRPDVGSLTRDAACYVYSHGHSEAKAKVDTRKAAKLSSYNHVSHGTKAKHL